MRGQKFSHGQLYHPVDMIDGSRIFLRMSGSLEPKSYSQEQAASSMSDNPLLFKRKIIRIKQKTEFTNYAIGVL